MIDHEFKEELMGALKTAVDLYNQDMGPSDSVTKAARDAGFNPEQSRRLAETFNTARTLYQYGTEEKDAGFELADPAEVEYRVLEPRSPKQAAPAPASYSEYDRPEYDAREGTVRGTDDVGDLLGFKAAQYNDDDLDTLAERMYKIARTWRETADEADSATRQCGLLLEKSAEQALYSIKAAGFETGADKLARIRVLSDGRPEMETAVGCLTARCPEPLLKQSEENIPYYEKSMVVVSDDIDGIMDDLEEHGRCYKRACDNSAAADTMRKEAEADVAEMEGAILSDAPEKYEDPFEGISIGPGNGRTIKRAAGGVPARRDDSEPERSGEAGEKDKDKDKDEDKDKDKQKQAPKAPPKPPAGISKLTDKWMEGIDTNREVKHRKAVSQYRDQVDSARDEAVLTELYLRDPIISEADPELLEEAYNTVRGISPAMAGNKEVMRSVLRHFVNTIALDPYDAKGWADFEKTMRQLDSGQISDKKQENK